MIKRTDTRRRGNLTELIEIQQEATVLSPSGSPITGWVKLCAVMAEVTFPDGRQFLADQNGFFAGQTSAIFCVHYREGITQAMRILYRGQSYEITAVLQQDNRRRLEFLEKQ
mgnify:FL=1